MWDERRSQELSLNKMAGRRAHARPDAVSYRLCIAAPNRPTAAADWRPGTPPPAAHRRRQDRLQTINSARESVSADCEIQVSASHRRRIDA